MKTLLTLFDRTLVWAEPYLNNGWQICQIDNYFSNDLFHRDDPILGMDVLNITAEWMYENIFDNCETINGVIAALPCTHIAGSGAWLWKTKDNDGRTIEATNLIQQVLRIVDICQPMEKEDEGDEFFDFFWAIENPVGRMNKLEPDMKHYGPWYFQPWWYGDAYTKKTGLWGEFKKPVQTHFVEPEKLLTKESSVDYYWRVRKGMSMNSKNRNYYRSITPSGFANAFYLANH